MDRIGSSNKSLNQCYEPNASEPPQSEATTGAGATCPDGTVDYEGVCANTELKGPQTSAQRYILNLAPSEERRETTASQAAHEVAQAAALSARDSVQQLVEEAGAAAMDTVRRALDNGSMDAGKTIEYAFALPNGCKAKFSVTAALESHANGPELVTSVSGTIEGKLGVVSAEVTFAYSRSASGQETLSFGACAFGGIDQDAAQWGDVEAKAGLCSTVKDSTTELPTVELEAVAKAEAHISFGKLWSWGHDLEVRTMLSKETLRYDFLR